MSSPGRCDPAPGRLGDSSAPVAPLPAKLGGSDGDRDTLRREAPEDALAELVLDRELLGERPDLAGEREVEGEIAEARNEPRRRRRLREEPRYVAHRAIRFLDEEALDQVRVGAVVDADANQEREPPLRPVVIRDDRPRHARVR